MTTTVPEVDERTLMLEFLTAAMDRDEEPEYIGYIARRIREERLSALDVIRFIACLASFGATAVREWANDTDRAPHEVMQAIALDVALDDLFEEDE